MDGLHTSRPKHGIAELEPGFRLHYIEAGTGTRTIVLIHGYPQTAGLHGDTT